MTDLPGIGKISSEVFDELIFPRLGANGPGILIGPQHGVDVSIVEIGDKAAAFTTDPVFIVPEYGWKRAAWFAIHILASDAVTSGLKPTYLCIDLNLPLTITRQQLEIVWTTMHCECQKMGISIISGHTAKYENCHYPMVGGATVVCVGQKEDYVSPRMIRPGDKVIITKGPAIEACGILSTMFPNLIEEKFGSRFAERAQNIFYLMSVVDDALTAVSVGVRDNGVTAMHDATECGVWGALCEICRSSGLGIRIELSEIIVEECVVDICQYFGIDPFASISEGTLIITCRERQAQQVVDVLSKRGIKSSVAGEMTHPKHGMVLVESGKEAALVHPEIDPFWRAFYSALEEHASSPGTGKGH